MARSEGYRCAARQDAVLVSTSFRAMAPQRRRDDRCCQEAVLRSAPSARVWATPTLLPASDDPTGCSDDRHRNNGAVLAPYELEPGRAWLAYSNVLAFFLESSASSQLKNGAPRCVVGAEGAKTCTSRLPGPVGARVARKAPPGRRSDQAPKGPCSAGSRARRASLA